MPIAYRFSRAGKVFKELDDDEGHLIAGLIRNGLIVANDDYWMPGMTEWKKVFTRDWVIAKPAPANTATAAAHAAETAQSAAAASSMPVVGRTQLCECTACKKGFNTPAKAVSGYSVIGKAAIFFLCGVGLLVLIYAMKDSLMDWSYRSSSRFAFYFSMTILGLVALSALCLFLMALFELIAAGVTHGIYRASPERCPYCNSATFTKKI
jgi:hypothetical protein